jgi:hypothetical protein
MMHFRREESVTISQPSGEILRQAGRKCGPKHQAISHRMDFYNRDCRLERRIGLVQTNEVQSRRYLSL